jgi:hypothetical protein
MARGRHTHLLLLLEQLIARFTMHLHQPLQETIALAGIRLPSRPDASSTACRVPSGSFAKSLRAKSILVLGFMVAVFLEVDFQRMQ